ncbi:MAG: hypothetical protein WC992_07070 [Acholeplasmataceae bacterium]|jgi:hypothetical protein
MSDRVFAWIRIGGPLTDDQMTAVLGAAATDGAEDENGDEPSLGTIKEAASAGRPLYLQCNDAAGGNLPAITDLCRRENIPYDLGCEGYPGSFEAAVESFRPPAKCPTAYDASRLRSFSLEGLAHFDAAVNEPAITVTTLRSLPPGLSIEKLLSHYFPPELPPVSDAD